jgi:glycine cleavage system aminomethyltransferase T
LFDLAPFSKFEVGGPGALPLLQKLAANDIDQPIGKVTYTALLTERGGIKCDLTITRLAAERFWVVTGGGLGMLDLAWIRHHQPADESVRIVDLSSAWSAVGVWGPRARDLLATVAQADLGNERFPYLTAQQMFVGAIPVLAIRISYAGELGWEIYSPAEFGQCLWDMIWTAGRPFGLVAVGGGAFDSLRLEKGYRLWGTDIHTDYNPYEAGLGFAVRMGKGGFLGREALSKIKASGGPARRLCCLVLEDPAVALMGKEPVFAGSETIGHVASANFGYSVGRSIAYAYLPAALASVGTPVEIYYFGRRHKATVAAEPLFDPQNVRLKS